MNPAQLINQTSGEVEWYTPPDIIHRVRRVFGGTIDLDPASSELAQRVVKATRFFTKDDNGLSREWHGNVWMNHPFGKQNRHWIGHMIDQYYAGHIKNVICITYACTSEKWFQPLLDGTQCWLSPRTKYVRPDGTEGQSPSKGSVLTFFGEDEYGAEFVDIFREFGRITMSL